MWPHWARKPQTTLRLSVLALPIISNSYLKIDVSDILSIVSNLQPTRFNKTCLKKSFFYRTHTEWNALPLLIRQIACPFSFKNELIKHLWKFILDGQIDTEDEEDLYDIS